MRAQLKALAIPIAYLLSLMASMAALNHSSAWLAYGLLSGWWLSLYLARLLDLRLSQGFAVWVAYFLLSIAAIPFEFRWFQHDLPSQIDRHYLIVQFMIGAAIAAPVFLNRGIAACAKLLQQGLRAHD